MKCPSCGFSWKETPRTPLTKMQRRVLDFVVWFIDNEGHAPTLREMMEHFGWRSTATAHEHLENLQSKGCLKVHFYAHNGIEVLRSV